MVTHDYACVKTELYTIENFTVHKFKKCINLVRIVASLGVAVLIGNEPGVGVHPECWSRCFLSFMLVVIRVCSLRYMYSYDIIICYFLIKSKQKKWERILTFTVLWSPSPNSSRIIGNRNH